MIFVVNSLTNPNGGVATRPQMIGSYAKLTKIQLQVKGAATVTIARTAAELCHQIGGVNQGLDLVAALGVVELWWWGEMFAIASVNSSFVDVQAQSNATAGG